VTHTGWPSALQGGLWLRQKPASPSPSIKTMSGDAGKAVGPRSQQELDALIANGLAPILREWLRELPPKPPVETPEGAGRVRGGRSHTPRTHGRMHSLVSLSSLVHGATH
jgi:hypothetical protein